MKKMHKILTGIVLSLSLTNFCFAEGGLITFDPTNWISGLNRLYATYDQITNSLKQIEQNYQRMQHAIEEAKSLDWQNIQWDGDIDFRDEIRQVGTQVNKRLDLIRRAEDCFTKKTIKFGKQSFSYNDLMSIEGWNNMGNAFSDSSNNSYKEAMEAWCGKLTDKQKRKIMRKYGISPQNYYRTKAREALLQAEMAQIVGMAEKELQNDDLNKNQEMINEVMKKIMAGGTQKEIAQYTALLQSLVLQKMDLLKQQQDEAIAQQAQLDMLTSAKDAEAETRKQLSDSMAAGNKYNYETNFLGEAITLPKDNDDKNVKIPGF